MKRNDRISEDVIKIFNNSKESIRKDVKKWSENAHVTANNKPKKHSIPKKFKIVIKRESKDSKNCSKEHSYQ